MAGRVTPNPAAIRATVCTRRPSSPVSSYIACAIFAWRGVSLGFCPPVRPRVRAAASPSLAVGDLAGGAGVRAGHARRGGAVPEQPGVVDRPRHRSTGLVDLLDGAG